MEGLEHDSDLASRHGRNGWVNRAAEHDSDLASRHRERMAQELERAQDDAVVLIRAAMVGADGEVGIDPTSTTRWGNSPRFPRPRGDRPAEAGTNYHRWKVPPPTRG